VANNQKSVHEVILAEDLNRVTYGTTAPTVLIKGKIWVDTTPTVPVIKVCDGSTWRDTVPSGIIAIWSGSIATIPSGWKICDGTLSTPDLRDKFIRGAAAAAGGGGAGGFDTNTHTSGGVHTHNAIANHAHAGSSVATEGPHANEGGHSGHGTPTTATQITTGGAGFVAHQTHEHDDFAGGHTHTNHSAQALTIASTDGHTHTSTGTGHTDHGTHDNKPVYYTVLFIMKI
jgi:hypothetical protein